MQSKKHKGQYLNSQNDEYSTILDRLEVLSADKLIAECYPSNIRLRKTVGLPKAGMSSYEYASYIRDILSKNKPFRSFIGMGYYQSVTPAVIMREVFENQNWHSQSEINLPEISQGKLEALFNFQLLINSLTQLPVANCSWLDEATATAEAMTMMYGLREKEAIKNGCNILFVDQKIYPQTFDLLLTRSEPLGIEIITDDFEDYEFTGREFGAIVQYPASTGEVIDYSSFTQKAHQSGILVTAVCDLMALTLLKAPALWGADIAVGSIQRMGLPMAFGGMQAAYMATKEEFRSHLPGCIVRKTTDRIRNDAFCLKATTENNADKSAGRANSQLLMAIMSGFYSVFHGAEGLRSIALDIHTKTATIYTALSYFGCNILSDCIFDTLEVEIDVAVVSQSALERGFNFYYPDDQRVHFSVDQTTTDELVASIIEIFAEATGKRMPKSIKLTDEIMIPLELLRENEILSEKVFNTYRNEMALMRYIKSLENKDLNLSNANSAAGTNRINLGSAESLSPLSLAEVMNIHPFAPSDQVDGLLEIIDNLGSDLNLLTGMDACSLQACSSEMGEFTALMIMRAYYQSRNQSYRNIVLLPESTNYLSKKAASMAGMRVVSLDCDKGGNIIPASLRSKLEEHGDELCCLILSDNSSNILFNNKLRNLIDDVHDTGAQIYMSGSGVDSTLGITNPGYIGVDLCQLHFAMSTSSIPPEGNVGVGAICVSSHLSEFLPSHSMVECGGINGITAVCSAPYGNTILHLMAYGYIKLMGEQGLRNNSINAIVNANYLAYGLKSEFEIITYGSKSRVANRFTIDLSAYKQTYGISSLDISRRLIDYGISVSPCTTPLYNGIEIELEGSESKSDLDRLSEALLNIKKECELSKSTPDNVITNAPHPVNELSEDAWQHNYTRKQAFFPLEWVKNNKFFTFVSKINR